VRDAGLTFVRLLRFARPYVGVVVLALLFSLAYAGGRSLRAYLMKPLMDEVLIPAGDVAQGQDFGWALLGMGEDEGPEPTPGESAETEVQPAPDAAALQDSLRKVLLTGLVIVLLIPVTHFGKDYLVEYTLGRILVDIQQALCRKLLILPLRFHHARQRGETLSRVMNDVGRSHVALQLVFADLLQSLLGLLVGFAVLLSISWELTLILALVLPAVMGVIGFFGSRIRRTAKRRQETLGNVTQRLVEILAGIKVIQAFRGEAREAATFEAENQRFFRRSMKVVKNRVLSRAVIEGLNNGIGICVLMLGVMLVLDSRWGLTQGDLAAFVTVMFTTYRPTKDLTKGWAQLMDALPSAERFFELLDEPPGVEDAPDAVAIDGVRQQVRIRKVSFSYGREPVLRNVSVDVQAGEVVAIVGRTGAGKTTLIDLLLRFHDPDAGSIEIDGRDLREIQRSSLLQHVAVVSQEPFLFGGTIGENIRYARPEASLEEVERAARAAHVDEFVRTLPEGYDTEVGEGGVQLSGGQRQRVTIARAILKDPAILIFDEATSSLDSKSERYVQEAIESLLSGRTVFVIAHRLSTIRHADKIVVLEHGTVAAVGSHDELLASDGLYSDLVALQNDDGRRAKPASEGKGE
jgi:subfamily B ATP-binding cassette protein MsbA